MWCSKEVVANEWLRAKGYVPGTHRVEKEIAALATDGDNSTLPPALTAKALGQE